MRTFVTLTALAVVALSFSACLDSKDEITLKKDGSGTIKSEYVVDLKKAAGLYQTVASFGMAPPEIPDPLPNAFCKGWVDHLANKVEGFEITKTSEATKDKKRTNTIEAKFTTLEAAAKGGAFFTSIVELSKTDEGWKLSLKDSLLTRDPAELGGIDPKQMLPMMENMLDTLSIKRYLALPTEVVSTNGKKGEDGKSVKWTVDYDSIVEGEEIEMVVVFKDAEDLKLKPFKFTPSDEELQVRFTQDPPKPKVVTGDGEKKDDPEKKDEPKKDEDK